MTALASLIAIPPRNTDDAEWRARMDARFAAQVERRQRDRRVQIAAAQAKTVVTRTRKAKRATDREPHPLLPVVTPCTGPCGRPTRSSRQPLSAFPGTVERRQGGMCKRCREQLAGGAA